MSKINWNVAGEKVYETGVDRAVLYVNNQSPVPWNSIVSVSNSPTGGEVNSYFYDGVKYVNNVYNQEFKINLKCFSYPYEFNYCNGISKTEYRGLLASNQNRSEFNLTYRTKVFNDNGDIYYKIHLVYNAIVKNSSITYPTINNLATPIIHDFEVTVNPIIINGYSSTAHRVVETKNYSQTVITSLEDFLYGTDATAPNFPTNDQLTTLLSGV